MDSVECPPFFPYPVQLMTRPPAKRLGCGPSGEKVIKKHPFFAVIDWNALEKRQLPAPEKPRVVCGDRWISYGDVIDIYMRTF